MIEAVFFDLDGTLADTAPDFAAILHRLQAEHGLPPTPYETLRTHVSSGVRGMLGIGFGLTSDADNYAPLAARFLGQYADALCVHSRLFQGIAELLDQLDGRGIRWGIVSNKPERLAVPLVDALGLRQRAACVIGGDTALRPKPHADPLLLACTHSGVQPGRSLYVGDDIRDITAGRAAGMRTLAAAYGYLGTVPIDTWSADAIISHPLDVLHHV